MNNNKSYLIIILSILSAIAPISIATYLPSMPIMAEHYKVNISDIELSLSIFMFGFSIGQIFGGPFSDAKGRKLSSLVGLLGYSIFSFLITSSTSVYELWIYRFFEAFFGGLIIVNAAAIIRDLYSGKEAAKYFSILGSLRTIVPMLAPALGALILFFFTWEKIFIFLGLYSAFVAFLIFKDFKETYTYSKKNIIQSYLIVLSNKKAMTMMFVLALGFSSMFSIVTKSSFIYIEYLGLSVNQFAFFQGLNFVFFMLIAALNVKFLNYFKAKKILQFAVLSQIILAFLFLILNDYIGFILVIFFIVSYISMNGLIYGNATALIMENFPHNAGVASALIGVLQYGTASIISSIIVSFHSNSLISVAFGMLIISSVAFLVLKKY
ncbi:multidrug effflux MFS transporter [Arcobacter arenosus]|uniref:Multidrug effflux MFS transporter n=1 Tax=Arcobacter arenosus TaxID=2576037 RepID=A0A5R8Y000_9BACT|nr:multidrug effflux MFS transporter [Arcobacter arenosus]TLP37715.1 multidrug effflux MFS transporter [Arcobacter arenosus]